MPHTGHPGWAPLVVQIRRRTCQALTVYNCVARSLVRRGRGLVDSVYVDSSQREHQQRADYLGMFASEVVFKVSRCQTSFMRVLVNSRMSPSVFFSRLRFPETARRPWGPNSAGELFRLRAFFSFFDSVFESL